MKKRRIWEKGKKSSTNIVLTRIQLFNQAFLCFVRGMTQFIQFEGEGQVKIQQNIGGNAKFNFDQVFNSNAPQALIYEQAVKPIVLGVMEGFNGTVFAYGQTSSGKTHTMLGPNITDEAERGMIPRMVDHIFQDIADAPTEMEFEVKVSMVEIYMEKVHDLINPSIQNLKIREEKGKGVYIENVTEIFVADVAEVYEILITGSENRSISATDMNARSSRSHTCLIVTVTQSNKRTYSSKTGQLYLVDLAGSERTEKTGAKGKLLAEANMINKSLTNLGNVINHLTDGKSSHIPYRDSKLTRILQESLGGNAKTSLIITCSPAKYNLDETVSTLRFGARAKRI